MMLAESNSCWYALTVKPNHEKAAAGALEYRGMQSFLPLYRSRRRWSDRFRELDLPLFAGYIFCRFQREERSLVLATPGVNSVVGLGRAPEAVPEEEIESVRRLVSSRLPVTPWPFLRAGERVRIEAGPLRGLEGILTQVKDAWRVVVSVELLQRSVAAEVDRDVLSVVRRAAPPSAAAGLRGDAGWGVHVCS
jgi:transcription antitermination factor NusG